MSLRVAIQTLIIKKIEEGTFHRISYSGNTPVESMETEAPLTVWVNETSGQINNDVTKSSQQVAANFKSWNFQAIVKFKHEVDTSTFVTDELSGMVLSTGDVLVQVKVASFHVTHPVTGGPPNGSHITMNLTATTRR